MNQIKIPLWLLNEVEDYFRISFQFIPNTILDIGANIGAFAIRAHQEWPLARITCYEPMPYNVKQLYENVNKDWCTVYDKAIRDFSGECDIYVGDMFVTGGFFKWGRQLDNTIKVMCVSAQALPSFDLVKIDTEGCELEIIRKLDLSNTKIIMLEHHSLSDGSEIRSLLSNDYYLAHDETNQEVGTEIYVRA